MDLTAKAAYFFLDLLLPLAVGYCSRYTGLGEGVFQRLMMVSIQAVYPVLAFLGFWAIRLNLELSWLPFLGLASSVLPGIIAYFRAKGKYDGLLEQGSYIMAATLPNGLVLGGISAFIFFGETGFVYTQLITLLVPALVFLVCFPVASFYASGPAGAGSRMSFREVIFSRNQLAAVGLLAGALLYYGGVPRPAWAGALFDPLVHVGAWTSLIPVGRAIDFTELKRYWTATLDLVPIRFIAAPVLSYALARLVVSDQVALDTIFVTASTPTGIFAVVTTKVQGLNVHITLAAFILTTVLYLLAVFPLQLLYYLK